MFVVIKKNNILFLVAIFFVSVIMLNLSLKNEIESVFSPSKVVVIDPGHGNIDGGAVGNSGSIEKDINLSICKKIKEHLKKDGFNVVLTREDDSPLTDTNGKNVRQIKRDDLKYRKKMRDAQNTSIFVSVHMNKFHDEKQKGAQTFYANLPSESKLLGEVIQKNMIEYLDKSNRRVAKVDESSIYILKDAKTPSVLVECGFLSNAEEEKLLLTDEYQNKVAYAIYKGIKEYYSEMKQ